jgi:hypothetical protein
MTVHLVKLCVGCGSLEELAAWLSRRLKRQARAARPPSHAHVTRMAPRRADELLDGGSLYWVIRGNIQVRQRLLDLQPFRDGEGVERCRLLLEPRLVPTAWQPRRAFQGWRYLPPTDAPADLDGRGDGLLRVPPELRHRLADLGLL